MTPYGDVCLAALRGREGGFSDLAAATKDEAMQRGEGIGIGLTDWATAVHGNGLGHYENAMAAAETACAYLAERLSEWGLVELVEAAVRCGSPKRADDAVRRLSECRRAASSPPASQRISLRVRNVLAHAAQQRQPGISAMRVNPC